MAYIPPGRQYEQKEFTVGVAKATAWHTPVSVASKILQFVDNIGFGIQGPARPIDSGIGRKFGNHNPPLGKIDVKGDLAMSALTYGQMTSLFANPCGKDTVTGNGSSTPYTHTLSIEDTLYGKFLTLAYLFRGGDTVEFPSVKFHGFEITANPGEAAKGKFNGLADFALTKVDDSRAGACTTNTFTPTVAPNWITNQWVGFYLIVDTGSTAVGTAYPITANSTTAITATGIGTVGAVTAAHIGPYNTSGAGGTFNTLSFDAFGDRIHFDDLLVRLGTAGTGSLTSADDFNIGQIKLAFERPMVGDHRSASTGQNILSKHAIWEPRDSNICKLDIEIQFPNYDAQTEYLMRQWINTAPQAQRIELVWTSPVAIPGISPAAYYSFSCIIPSAFIGGSPVVIPAHGGVPVTLKYEGTFYTAAGTDTAPYFVIVNGESGASI
jgi:hypothetical protein